MSVFVENFQNFSPCAHMLLIIEHLIHIMSASAKLFAF